MKKRAGEVEVTAPLADPPDWLPEGAKAEWNRVLEISGYAKALTEADRGLLTTYCLVWQEIAHVVARDGSSILIPASRLQLFANIAGKLGMTPSDRVKVRMPEEKKPANKFGKL
jgi:phage terminase small subunit